MEICTTRIFPSTFTLLWSNSQAYEKWDIIPQLELEAMPKNPNTSREDKETQGHFIRHE
ncbi:hypothetical protein GcM3_014016, partial [Golovinomyces cichoracearum]